MGVMHDNEETCCLGRTDARAHNQRTVDFVTLDCHRQVSSCLTHKPNYPISFHNTRLNSSEMICIFWFFVNNNYLFEKMKIEHSRIDQSRLKFGQIVFKEGLLWIDKRNRLV